jgi:hypothetical protein
MRPFRLSRVPIVRPFFRIKVPIGQLCGAIIMNNDVEIVSLVIFTPRHPRAAFLPYGHLSSMVPIMQVDCPDLPYHLKAYHHLHIRMVTNAT